MTSPLILDEIQVANAYDDRSFIRDDHSYRVRSNDPTRAPAFPADKSRGDSFEPFNIEQRDLHVNPLPQTPLELFKLFVPIWLVEKWVNYSNSWVASLLERGVIDNWNHPITRSSRIRSWLKEGISAAEVYIWLGVLIYVGVHKERSFESHWKAPKPGEQRPFHSIIKFMTLKRFQLLHRYLRPFDHRKIDETAAIPKVFQAADEWSGLIQAVSAELFEPGTHLAVDECMVRYTGRSNETAVVKGKPTPLGFKIWVIAQKGFFMRWLWHLKGAQYGAIGIEPPKERSTRGRGRGQGRGRSRGIRRKAATEANSDKVIPLNSTQSIVITLCNLLPKKTYHVFVDNLFSSADLFRSLRSHGHGATGTARPNCGIHKELKADKARDKSSGKESKMSL